MTVYSCLLLIIVLPMALYSHFVMRSYCSIYCRNSKKFTWHPHILHYSVPD